MTYITMYSTLYSDRGWLTQPHTVCTEHRELLTSGNNFLSINRTEGISHLTKCRTKMTNLALYVEKTEMTYLTKCRTRDDLSNDLKNTGDYLPNHVQSTGDDSPNQMQNTGDDLPNNVQNTG